MDLTLRLRSLSCRAIYPEVCLSRGGGWGYVRKIELNGRSGGERETRTWHERYCTILGKTGDGLAENWVMLEG